MRTTWSSYSNARLVFGPGALKLLGKVVSRLHGTRVFIITDPVLESHGIAERAKQAIDCNVQIYAGGEVEPSTIAVHACTDAARAFAPDVTIAIGGGSNMDLAKLTCATLATDQDPTEFFGFDKVPGPIGNLICVPTTAGTGSESSHSAVIENSKTGMKAAAISHYLRPMVAVVDPELTISCPAKLTAESGIDALTHAIEGYLATAASELDESESGALPYEGNHPVGDLYSEKAIRLIGEHFLNVVVEPEDLHARSGMALAATFGGLAFSNCGVAAVHALEYPIGNRYKCAHGIGNGIMLPETMRFLWPAREGRIARIGHFLGVEESADAAIDEVIRLRKAAGLPENLRSIGAEREDLPELAAGAHALERLMVLTPRKPSEKDLLGILEASF